MSLLYCKKEAFHINIEHQVIFLLSYLAKVGKLRDTSICEYNIELAPLLTDLFKDAVPWVNAAAPASIAGELWRPLH